jgi:hypothetical protein
MKKKISYLLILISIFGLVGCSNNKQVSFSSINLKQEYIKEFTPTFTGEAGSITKLSASLYNQAVVDKIPERETFEFKYNDFDKIITSNDREIDFKVYINSFARNYTVLSANEFIFKNAKMLKDSGILSKDDYDENIKESKINKDKYLQKIKIDIENIMKYYE